MIQYLSRFKTVSGINACEPDFLQKLEIFYHNDIIMPKKNSNEMMDSLKKEYSIVESNINHLDSITHSIISTMQEFHGEPIWILPYNKSSSSFYNEFYSHYVCVNKTPKIVLFFQPKEDLFISNSSFFQLAIEVCRGIDPEYALHNNAQYKSYLNALFMLSELLTTIRFHQKLE